MLQPRPFFTSAIALAALLVAPTAQAQRLMDWRGEAPAAVQAAPVAAGTTAHQGPALEITGRGAIREVWVRNPLAGPAQLQVHGTLTDGARSVPALPVSAALAAGERRQLARLYPGPGGDVPARLTLDVVPGATQAGADDTLYRLPFAAAVHVDQGFGGRFSHHDAANRYALDFALPEGTPILAARDGMVMEVRAGFAEGGRDSALGGRANLVRILHGDGSMAVYAHLAPDGVDVRAGQQVRAGEPLGRSGNTGLSTAPHLHFAIQLNRGLQLVSVPFRIAGPLGELKFPQPAGAAP